MLLRFVANFIKKFLAACGHIMELTRASLTDFAAAVDDDDEQCCSKVYTHENVPVCMYVLARNRSS